MGYLGRRIGKSQDTGNAHPESKTDVGGGVLDLFAAGYFERQGKSYNAPGEPLPEGMIASGGIISDYTSGSNAYRAHTFTTSGAFEVTSVGGFGNNIEFLVVAGGGGGGGSRDNYAGQGGGGAGGLITNMPGVATPAGSPNPNVPLTRSATFDVAEGGTYPVVVGGGGIGGMYPGNPGRGGNGSDSVLTHTSAPKTITATGGGGGSGATDAPTQEGADGGSGGGGSGYPTSSQGGGDASPNSNPDRQGHPGGDGAPGGPDSSGGGGGGAGGPGEAGLGPGHPRGARGGLGVSASITGIATVYAGGGGSGFYFNPNSDSFPPSAPENDGGGGSGGLGGNGNRSNTRGYPGTPGSGGGGGGATAHHPPSGPRRGGDGGGGVVIVRYQIGTITAQQKATGGLVSYYGNKTIHTFTGNGTFATTSNWDAGTNEVEYVCVGGGGGGGGTDPNCWGAGGGGAGQMRTGTTTISHPSPVAIAIGAGGRGGTKYDGQPGSNGSNTTIGFPAGTITGYGGGSGASNAPNTSSNGNHGVNYPNTSVGSGSGGGANRDSGSNAGIGGPAALGAYPGGSMPGGNHYVGAGGGGAGGAGGRGSDEPSARTAEEILTDGIGGVGLQVPTTFRDPAVTFDGVHSNAQHYLAGGGGGGMFNPSPQVNPDKGGKGGGGAGGGGAPGVPGSRGFAGGTNTGGGGGGAGSFNDPTVFYGGHGGSGIVLIAYPT
jgi:hypothetical protein